MTLSFGVGLNLRLYPSPLTAWERYKSRKKYPSRVYRCLPISNEAWRLFLKIIICVILLLSQIATADEWLCTTESGQRQGNLILACGVGESSGDEAYARKRALSNAIEEFNTICEISSDCAGRKIIVEPKRTSCAVEKNGLLKCYRLIAVTLE